MRSLALVWLVACCMLQHGQAETVLLVNATAIPRSGEWVQVLPTILQAWHKPSRPVQASSVISVQLVKYFLHRGAPPYLYHITKHMLAQSIAFISSLVQAVAWWPVSGARKQRFKRKSRQNS